MYTRVICSFPSPRTPSACTAGFWFYSTSTNSIYVCIVDSPLQAPRYTQGSSPWAPKATRGSVACACMLVSPLYLNRLCICICMYERINVDMYMHMSIYTSFFFFSRRLLFRARTPSATGFTRQARRIVYVLCVFVCMCVCVCVHICIYIYMYGRVCFLPSPPAPSAYTVGYWFYSTSTNVIFVCVYAYVCINVYVCMHMYVCMCICICLCRRLSI